MTHDIETLLANTRYIEEMSTPPATPAAGTGVLYLLLSDGHIYFKTSTATYDLTDAGMSNPMTASQDLIIGGASGTPARLAKGSNGTYLGVDGTGNLAYSAIAGATLVAAKVHNSAVQSIPNAVATNLTFDTEIYDTDAFHSIVSNTDRYTIPSGKAGKYRMGVRGQFAGSTGGTTRQLTLGIDKGGGSVNHAACNQPPHPTATVARMECWYEDDLSVGDIITANVLQDSGGALNFGGTYPSTGCAVFMLHYLGA